MRSRIDAAVLEQLGQHAVRDGGADLRLDVVADDRHAGLLELRAHSGVPAMKTGSALTKATLGVDGALRVELRGVLGADGQVADEHVDLGVLERPATTSTGSSSDSLDGLAVVLAETVEGVAALHGDARAAARRRS